MIDGGAVSSGMRNALHPGGGDPPLRHPGYKDGGSPIGVNPKLPGIDIFTHTLCIGTCVPL